MWFKSKPPGLAPYHLKKIDEAYAQGAANEGAIIYAKLSDLIDKNADVEQWTVLLREMINRK